MSDYSGLVQHTINTGIVASTATTIAASVCGALEDGQPIAPMNAVSHILWDDEAARHTEPSLQYTALGTALNAAAVTSWAAIYELCCGDRANKKDIVGAVVGGALVSAAAYITDYHIVPRRVTPGFELRLSNRSLFGIYTTLALSLAAGSLLQPGRMLSRSKRSRAGLNRN